MTPGPEPAAAPPYSPDAAAVLPVGADAPDFTLEDQHGAPVTLSSYRGRRAVLLVFYPFSFTGVCTSEMKAIQRDLAAFQNDTVQVLGVSCDSTFVQRAFSDEERLRFPVLADRWPLGAVARAYGVFDESIGAAKRGTFVIDAGGMVRWSVLNAAPDRRSTAGYRDALATLAAG